MAYPTDKLDAVPVNPVPAPEKDVAVETPVAVKLPDWSIAAIESPLSFNIDKKLPSAKIEKSSAFVSLK